MAAGGWAAVVVRRSRRWLRSVQAVVQVYRLRSWRTESLTRFAPQVIGCRRFRCPLDPEREVAFLAPFSLMVEEGCELRIEAVVGSVKSFCFR